MALQSDREGFLKGDPLVIDRGDFGRAVGIWQSIKQDTAAIRSAVTKAADRASRPGRATNAPVFSDRQVAAVADKIAGRTAANSEKRQRTAAPKVEAAAQPRRQAARPKRDEQQSAPIAERAAVAATPQRGRNGRFLPRGGADDDSGGGAGSRDSGRNFGDGVADSIKQGVSEALSGTDQVDPAIAAAKEVGGLIGPLFKPVGGLLKRGFGFMRSEKDKETAKTIPWYKRMYKELRELNKKPTGAGGPGMLSGLGGLLMKVPGIPALGAIATGLGTLLKPLGGLLGKLALPVATMFSSIKSFNTSTEEYAQRMGIELNGSLAQELGVRFVGVLGDLGNTLTFGLAGKFGETISPAINDMVDGVVNKWGETTAWFEGKWGEAVKTWDDMAKKVSDSWQGITDWIGEKIGVAKKAATGAKEAVLDARDSASAWVGNKVDAVKSAFGGGSEGNRKALIQEMSAQGITDKREQAMFLAQMDHESGGFRNLEESFKYRSADRLMGVSASARGKGKAAVEAAMAQGPEAVAELMYGGRMGNTEKGDAYKFRGRGFTQLTGKANYAEAGKDLGLDLVNNPDLAADPANAAKIATWYWKKRGLSSAAQAGDVTTVTKRINGGTNGLGDRQAKYDSYLAAMNAGTLTPAQMGVPASAGVATPSALPATITPMRQASAAAPSIPPLLRAPSAAPAVDRLTPPAAPAPATPIGSNDKGKDKTEVTMVQPVTQNLGDRAIAHLATGGLGSYMGGV